MSGSDDNKVRVSAPVAAVLKGDAPRDARLKAARGELPLLPADLVVVLYYLAHDSDKEIQQAALTSLRELPEPIIIGLLENPQLHPQILGALARVHWQKKSVAQLVVQHDQLDEKTLAFLAQQGVPGAAERLLSEPVMLEELSEEEVAAETATEEQKGEEEPEVDEESEGFKSKFQQVQDMGVADKIKTALTGDKEWRSILIKDSNKLVSGSAIKNPRITEAEVLAISKSAIQNDEVIRVICNKKEWL
ncbi:MAG TPA: hypothetical protein VFR01_06545, partial [Geobacterales bacterium]|nr:hypothetical protein [Geobacterales bacterium]